MFSQEKQAEFSRHIQRKLDQCWQYETETLHSDVNGRLGGVECIVGTLVPRKGADMRDEVLVAYMLVDCLDTVQMRGQGEPSRWSVARLLCRAMRAGIPRRSLRRAIETVIREHVSDISGTELLRLQLMRQAPKKEIVRP